MNSNDVNFKDFSNSRNFFDGLTVVHEKDTKIIIRKKKSRIEKFHQKKYFLFCAVGVYRCQFSSDKNIFPLLCKHDVIKESCFLIV